MKFLFASVTAAAALSAFSSPSNATPFKKCKDGAEPSSLMVKGCDSWPCSVVRGNNMTAVVDFKAPRETHVLLPKVKATADLFVTTVSKSIEFSQKDGCSTLLRGHCPLKEGDLVTYYFTMPVKKTEIAVKADVEVALLDHYGDVLVCTLLPVSLE